MNYRIDVILNLIKRRIKTTDCMDLAFHIASKTYFLPALRGALNDETPICLDFGRLEFTEERDFSNEESAALVAETFLVRAASFIRGDINEIADKTADGIGNLITLKGDNFDARKAELILQEDIKKTLALSANLTGSRLFDSYSDMVSAFRERGLFPEAYAGALIFNSLAPDGNVRVEADISIHADEFEIFNLLKRLNACSLTHEDRNFIDFKNLHIYRMYETQYRYPDARLALASFINKSAGKYAEAGSSSVVTSSILLASFGPGDRDGAVLDGRSMDHRKRESYMICSANHEGRAYLAAVMASKYEVFSNILIDGKSPSEYRREYEAKSTMGGPEPEKLPPLISDVLSGKYEETPMPDEDAFSPAR